MPTTKEEKRKEILEAVEDSDGVIPIICTRAGISRTTLWRYRTAFPEIEDAIKNEKRLARESMDDLRENILDFAETSLYNLVAKRNIAAIIFFLKTQGKHRGWVEKDGKSQLPDDLQEKFMLAASKIGADPVALLQNIISQMEEHASESITVETTPHALVDSND